MASCARKAYGKSTDFDSNIARASSNRRKSLQHTWKSREILANSMLEVEVREPSLRLYAG